MKLAIFDFDGTITYRDGFIPFMFFTHGAFKAAINLVLVSPVLFLYLIKVLPNWKAKEIVFTVFYKGWPEVKFDQCARAYALDRLSALVRGAAQERLQWHKKMGHKIVVVSASFENYLGVWCEREGFDCLATKVEVRDQKLTGRFASLNCHREEKVRRIKEKYDLKDFEYVYAYGDTGGDLPLKSIANEFHFKPFRGRTA